MLRESTIARLGLIALALVEWRYGALLVWNGLLPLHPFAIALLIALYLSSFVLLLKATARAEPIESARWTFLPMLLVVVAFVFLDTFRKTNSGLYPTTDGHAYMDVAARLLVQGRNPYTESLVDAFRIYELPVRYSTPLLDGNFSDRVAYPSLSFLVLVPFVLAKLPTYLAYASCFLVALFWLVKKAPWWAQALVFVLFTHDETFISMGFDGVTDSVWMVCLLGAVLLWSRPTVAAVLVGLACAQKQHPWFFVPYLLIRIWHENGRGLSWKALPLRFVGIVVAVFVVLNLPFVLWGPKAWILGIVEPLVAPMIQLSEGLSALSMTGYVFVPRSITSIVFWLVFAYSLWLYARHTSAIREWCFILPAVVLWFGYRALMSYWYFNAILAVGALLTRDGAAEAAEAVVARSWKMTARIGVALATAIVAVLVVCALRRPPFEGVLSGPVEAWETHVFRVRLRVTNHGASPSDLRFSVQSGGNQPIQWIVDVGGTLEPGATSDFILLRAPRPEGAFELGIGARVSIADAIDPSRRGFVSVEPELSANRIDRIPNPSFHILDARTLAPFGWGLERSDSAVRLEQSRGGISFVFDEVQPGPPPSATCFPVQKVGSVEAPASRFGELLAMLELPLEDISLRVKVPNDANEAPWTSVYGLHLAMPGWNGYVLFGAREEKGHLPSGASFVNVPAARGEWAVVKLSFVDLLRELGAPTDFHRFAFQRFPDLDIPMTPLQIGLVSMRGAGASKERIDFGAFGQSLASRDEEAILRRSKPSAGRDEWRAARELENGNPLAAAAILDRIVATQPTLDRLILLGNVELRARRSERARDAFARALTFGSTPELEKGYGWSLVPSDPKAAIEHLERSRESFLIIEKPPVRPKYFDTLCGLVIAYAKVGDCGASNKYAQLARQEDPRFPPPVPAECQ